MARESVALPRQLQAAALLGADSRASPRWPCLSGASMSPETCNPGSCVAAAVASLDHQNAGARSSQALALWEQRLKAFESQLNPAVAAYREQGDDFTAGRNDDGDDRCSSRIHA